MHFSSFKSDGQMGSPHPFSHREKCVQHFPVTGTSVSKAGRPSLDAFWDRTSVRYGLGLQSTVYL